MAGALLNRRFESISIFSFLKFFSCCALFDAKAWMIDLQRSQELLSVFGGTRNGRIGAIRGYSRILAS